MHIYIYIYIFFLTRDTHTHNGRLAQGKQKIGDNGPSRDTYYGAKAKLFQ